MMAAETLSAKGFDVSIFEKKPSVGRKFLMAGRGGLNLTHSEDFDGFIRKYNSKAEILSPVIRGFTPQALRDWCEGLGEKTFVGSSGRVFPESFKASPLLRAWIKRLESQGVRFMLNHDWRGWDKESLVFQAADTLVHVKSDAVLLALGGASWPRLGSDGTWLDILTDQDVEVAPLRPSNCGFFVEWSSVFSERFAGQSLKAVELSFQDKKIRGEFMMTDKGIEGGAVYALSALLREAIQNDGAAQLVLDLKPDLSAEDMHQRLQRPRRGLSMSNYLRKALNLSDVAIGLLMERPDRQKLGAYKAAQLTQIIKSYALDLQAPFSIERAISTAGGVTFESLDENFMLVNKPGVFVAGEMLDWEAPTGGYLLQASIASGVYAANGMVSWLSGR